MRKTITLSRSQWSRFIRRAQASWPYEIASYLIGFKSENRYRVRVFYYPRLSSGHKKSFPVDSKMMAVLNRKASRFKMRVLGIVHSHPHAEVTLSNDDYKRMKSGEFGDVIGILRVRPQKEEYGYGFWSKVSRIPMPLKVILK